MFQQKSYLAKKAGPHFFEIKGPNAPKWYVVDAKDQVVGRLASMIAKVIIGKHKPTYTAHVDSGDFVVVINADKVALTRTKWDKKIYRDYSGYVSGLKERTAREMLNSKPEEIIRRAVWGMTNKSSLARHQVKKLKVYAGTEHPHQAQKLEELPLAAKRRSTLTKVTSFTTAEKKKA
jgi:large subunit ribosomal protein L13